jgi:hypothetical protein
MRMTGKLMATALIWITLAGTTHGKALSAFHGVLQFQENGDPVVVSDGIYERHAYPYFGTYLTIVTSDWQDYNPDHGDTWVLDVYNNKTQTTDAHVVLSYDAGSDCLVHQGSPVICGLYVAEGSHINRTNYLNIYFYGSCTGQHGYALQGTTPNSYDSWAFTPTRFRPDIDILKYASSIWPMLSASESDMTMVAALVVDDLGCRIPLHDIDVTFENRFVPGSGGHANITTEAPITGHYTVIEAYGGDIPDTAERSITFPNNTSQSYTVAPVINGKTNQLGWFAANYKAGIFGGEERLKATASIDHLSDKDPAAKTSKEDTLTIKVAGLVEMEKNGINHKFNFAGSCSTMPVESIPLEAEARWLTPNNKTRALVLANMWFNVYEEKLSYNDASLRYGGVIDSKTIAQGCHQTHRKGTNIDINRDANNLNGDCTTINGKQICRLNYLLIFAKAVGLIKGNSSGIHLQGD